MELQRYLDDFESAARLHGPTSVIEFDGNVHPEALARAFTLLGDHFPVLRGRVRDDGQGHLLYVDPDHRPEFRVVEGNDDTLVKIADRFLDASRCLVELNLIQRGNHGYVAMKTVHSIGDASAWGAMIAMLWRLYTAIVTKDELPAAPPPTLPVSCQRLLNERWGEIGIDKNAAEAAVHAQTTSDDADLIHLEQRQLTLSARDTARMCAAARALHTSVHALVCGSLLLALRHHDDVAGLIPTACITAIELRHRVTPRVGPTETTNFVTGHMSDLVVARESDPIAIGREIKRQITEAIEKRTLWTREFDGSRAATYANHGFTVADITNPGVIARLDQPKQMTITDYRWMGQPEDRRTAFKIGNVALTYDGRFSLRSKFPPRYTTEDIDLIHHNVSANLRRVIDEALPA